MEPTIDKDYWDKRYANNDAAWDVGSVSTPIKNYIDSLQDKNMSILIPGCGNAYEAEYLVQQGFTNITLIDISPILTKNIRQKFSTGLTAQPTIICGDFFEFSGSFDLIIEQTFLSALPKNMRKKYSDQMFALLNKKGKLAGVLFSREFEQGPPFGGSTEEYAALFSKKFTILKMEDCYNSIPPRAGNEVFIELQPKT